MDAAVWSWLHEFLTTPEILDRLVSARMDTLAAEAPRLAEDRARIADLVERKRAAFHRLLDVYLEERIDRSEFDSRRDRLLREITEHEEALASIDAQLATETESRGRLDALAALRDDLAWWIDERTDTFAHRREVVKRLGLTATLVADNGLRGAWVELAGGIRAWIEL